MELSGAQGLLPMQCCKEQKYQDAERDATCHEKQWESLDLSQQCSSERSAEDTARGTEEAPGGAAGQQVTRRVAPLWGGEPMAPGPTVSWLARRACAHVICSSDMNKQSKF